MRSTPIFQALVPCFMVGAYVGLAHFMQQPSFQTSWKSLPTTTPLIILAVGVVMAWRMKRSSQTLFLLLLCPLYVLLSESSVGLMLLRFQAAQVFLPWLLVVLVLTPDRGLVTVPGLKKLVLLLAPAGAFEFALRDSEYRAELVKYLPKTFLEGLIPVNAGALTDLGLVAFALAAVVLGLVHVFWTSKGALWGLGAVAALALACVCGPGHPMAGAWLSVASVVICLFTLQDSYRLAYIDELTDLPGRRALETMCLRLPGRYTIAMLDVDHFKKFNDTHGHHVGDDVLRLVGRVLKRVPGGGRAFRYGGEEFTIVFPGKKMEACLDHLETLRVRIEESSLVLPLPPPKKGAKKGRTRKRKPKSVSVTMSIGAAERSDKVSDAKGVLKAADAALYRAKKKGRNQVQT